MSGLDGGHAGSEGLDEGGLQALAILAALPDALVFTDLAGVVRFVNEAASALLGRDAAQLVGQPATVVFFPLSADARPVPWEASPLGRALKGERVDAADVCIAGADGLLSLSVSAAPVGGGSGRSSGAVAILRGDDRRRSADSHAGRPRAAVQDAIQSGARESAEAADILRQAQKMEAIGLLAGGVAHDFNNLLTVIRSSVDLLQRKDLSDERRARYVDAIGEAADRAAVLTAQLLAFARQQPLQAGSFDAHAVLQRLSQILRALAGPGVRLMIEADQTPCWVNASVSPFEIAIINLAVNARDAMDGDGEIRILLRHVEETPTASDGAGPGAFVAITVADTGVGIPADEMERIFEPFYTTKPVGRGTGLGLSQVDAFVRQSDGEVRVESRPGEGARFTLFLPRGEAVELPAAPATNVQDLNSGVLRILLVEDDERVAELSAQLLASLGISAVVVSSPEAALEALAFKRGEFDVMLTDVVMPGPIDGLQLARTVKSRWTDLPVVLTTGASDLLLETQADFAVLRKPFSAEALWRVLRQASGV